MSWTPSSLPSLGIEPRSLLISSNDASTRDPKFTLINKGILPVLYSIIKQDESHHFINVSPSCGLLASNSRVTVCLKIDAEKLTNSTLDFTRGHYLLIESWRISQDTGTDAMLLLAEIRSKGDKAPKSSLSEFLIRYEDPQPAQQIPSSLQRSSTNSSATPIESPSPLRTCSQSSLLSLQNNDSTNTSGRSRDVPSSTVEGTSTRFAQSASEVQASVGPIGPSRSEYSLKNSSSRFVLADGGSGDYVIAVDDIVIQGSDPYDVTGHFSDLFIGIHKGNVKVAMKRLRIGKRSSHGHEIEKLEHEAAIWLILKHPHILHFMGIYRANGHMYLVSPFMVNGNLADYIRHYPDRERTSFLLETAAAVAYLHAKGIVHADIKARNILVSESHRAILCDFGLAKYAPSITASASKGQGSVRWQDREVLNGVSRSFASDTYAFGITISEVLSGDIPFPHLKGEPAVIRAVVFGGQRPARLPTHSRTGESYEKLWNTAAQCWDEDPQFRPRMDNVYNQLRGGSPTSPADASGTSQSGESSPTSSTDSFVTAMEGDLDEDSPIPDEIVSGSDGISPNSLELSLPEPGLPLVPPVLPPSLPLGVPRRNSLDTTERQWMIFTPVGTSTLRGQVKIPQGQPHSRGMLSDVYQCEVRFHGDTEEKLRVVAVRVLRAVAPEGSSDIQALHEIMQRLTLEADTWSALDHPNIAPLIGITFTPVQSLIYPWSSQGTFRTYLLGRPDADRLKLLHDIAKGLAYLHSRHPPVIHGNVRPENVLINENGDALIMGLGLKAVLEATSSYSAEHLLPGVRWMPPELLQDGDGIPSCNTDVYSFGGVAIEVMTSEPPYSGLSEQDVFLLLCDPQNHRVPFDDWGKYPQLPNVVKSTIVQCWSQAPKGRPSMKVIEEWFASLMQEDSS